LIGIDLTEVTRGTVVVPGVVRRRVGSDNKSPIVQAFGVPTMAANMNHASLPTVEARQLLP
jgi:hypothetical protein